MDENNQKNENSNKNTPQDDQTADPKVNEEKSLEEKLSETEDKLLRSLAEIENQRRRFEKEVKDAFEFGSYNFAKESLAILDNLEREPIVPNAFFSSIKVIFFFRFFSSK